MKKELFADVKKYGWSRTRATDPITPAPRRRRKRHKAGATGLAWGAGVNYRLNITVTHGGVTYTCLEGHISVAGQTPDTLPLVWQAHP